MLIYSLPNNILSSYLTDRKNDFHLVLIFYEVIDFYKIELTDKAIVRLMTQVSSYCEAYPIESYFIYENFFRIYLPRMLKHKCDDKLSFVYDILLELITNIQNGAAKQMVTDNTNFMQSSLFEIWKVFLHFFYNNRHLWTGQKQNLAELFSNSNDMDFEPKEEDAVITRDDSSVCVIAPEELPVGQDLEV